MSVLTRDSEQRLGRLLCEVREFADQVVVGVDAGSVDGTLHVARSHADVAYQFRHSGQMNPASMLPFRYATGDWILTLDDDESIEQSFDEILPELLSERYFTHHWFRRKWIISLDPCEYIQARPWYPDWQLRLFRNDPTIVWKPLRPHSGYHVLGPGSQEVRASILHFEPVWCTDEARLRKVEDYRKRGAAPASEGQYTTPRAAHPRREAVRRAVPTVRRRWARRRFDPIIHEIVPSATGWKAEVLSAEMPSAVSVGAAVQAEVRARNTGAKAWAPLMGGVRSADLNLAFHVLDISGRVLQEGQRYRMPRLVPPGAEVTFICEFSAPSQPGSYLIEWDLVNEGECWFQQVGGSVLRSALVVCP